MTGTPSVDQGNDILAIGPAKIFTSLTDTAAGQFMLLTIRTPSTTLTVGLGQQDARTWAKLIADQADGMSAAGLVAATAMPPQNGQVPHAG